MGDKVELDRWAIEQLAEFVSQRPKSTNDVQLIEHLNRVLQGDSGENMHRCPWRHAIEAIAPILTDSLALKRIGENTSRAFWESQVRRDTVEIAQIVRRTSPS